MSNDIDGLIERFQSTKLDDKDTENFTSLLKDISSTSDPKKFDKFELTDQFVGLIKTANEEVNREAAKCIAEITKSEIQRKKFTTENVIRVFIQCLQEHGQHKNIELTIQICRALGNICYLNEDAGNIILRLKGDECLINLLDQKTDSSPPSENDLQFIKVRGGLISNYLLGGEVLAKRAMELHIMDKLKSILEESLGNVEANEDLLLNTLPILSILTENVPDLNFDQNVNVLLSNILAASTNPDLAEMCLELLHYQAENDDVKLLLAKEGLCETIYNLLEKFKMKANSGEARALMKLACDLIVLILTGDESMHYLYLTPLLKNMEDWLNSTDIDLLTTGVLALGNFARTDSHCIYMVEHKIMNKLLDILSKNNGIEGDVRLQHALLSALRNLVIPKLNKEAVIEAGLVQTILPMLEIHQPPVVFKLLGTLRMTVDGQEQLALELLKNKTLIKQLVLWSKSSDYAGVTGESQRLMAWLIKYAYLTKVSLGASKESTKPNDLTSLIAFVHINGTTESMINMLSSQHLVMQNESLIALCILAVAFLNDTSEAKSINIEDQFVQHELGKHLAEFIKRASDNMTKEIVENLQNFVKILQSSDRLVSHLSEHNITELLKSIPILTEYCTL